jgi:hypothetical protein
LTSRVGSLPEGLKQQASDVRAAGEEISRALSGQQMDVALKVFSDKLEPRLRDIYRQASSLVAQQNGSLVKASAAAHAKSSRSRSITIGLGLLALVAGALVLGIVRQANRAFRLAASRLAKNAELVSSAASNVSESSRVLATEASEQTASLEETSSSTEEITCIARQNADHAGQVAALMVQNQQGIGQVDESLDPVGWTQSAPPCGRRRVVARIWCRTSGRDPEPRWSSSSSSSSSSYVESSVNRSARKQACRNRIAEARSAGSAAAVLFSPIACAFRE